MVGYKLSKNDWVTPFFVIFRSVREKLLVTVSFDHPVDKVMVGLGSDEKVKSSVQPIYCLIDCNGYSSAINVVYLM